MQFSGKVDLVDRHAHPVGMMPLLFTLVSHSRHDHEHTKIHGVLEGNQAVSSWFLCEHLSHLVLYISVLFELVWHM